MTSCQRVFLVGCPRSGTTVLQAAIGGHSQIATFPEPNFFSSAIGQYHRRFGHPRRAVKPWKPRARRIIGRVRELARDEWRPAWIVWVDGLSCLRRFVDVIGCSDLEALLPKSTWRSKALIFGYLRILDELARKEGKPIWLDKSPLNILYLDVIERYVPRPKVIHMVRRGEDVVASIYDAAQTYPLWRDIYFEPDRLDKIIGVWNRCYGQSERYRNAPNHLVLNYENFVSDPRANLQKVCAFLNIPFEETMLDLNVDPRFLYTEREPWKAATLNGIRPHSSKFERLFSPAQQDYIRAHLRATART